MGVAAEAIDQAGQQRAADRAQGRKDARGTGIGVTLHTGVGGLIMMVS